MFRLHKHCFSIFSLLLAVSASGFAQTVGENAAKQAAAAAHAAMMAGTTSAPSGTVHYYYTDPQGTVLAEADASGNIVATYDYMPYGAPVTSMGGPPDGPGYTGHVNDPETGFVYMQARYYDPFTDRFLSIDPDSPSPSDLFNFNRYVYANNNPLTNIDPDGRKVAYLDGTPQDFKNNFAEAIIYLNSQGEAGNFAKLQASDEIYYIAPASDRTDAFQTVYNPRTNTISWADKAGILVTDSPSNTHQVETPALAVGHEGEHALNDLNGTYQKDRSTFDKQFDNKEERKVIKGYENKAAKKLGEPIRNDHIGHGSVPCLTSTKC